MPEIPIFDTPPPKKASFTRPLIFILLLAGLFILARAFNLQEYVQEDRLRRVIAAYGWWSPFIYLLVWIITPTLLLPCLPLTLAAGFLFGPFLGVIYAAIGAAAGCSAAFLVARYLARDWVATKISGSKLAHLDAKVAEHGWKIVAFTRIIPIFPFFLLNYAFGLTRIPFLHYFLASIFAMLPWTIAFVLVASNILDLLRGEVSIWLIIGVILVALVSLLPIVFKKIKALQGESVDI